MQTTPQTKTPAGFKTNPAITPREEKEIYYCYKEDMQQSWIMRRFKISQHQLTAIVRKCNRNANPLFVMLQKVKQQAM